MQIFTVSSQQTIFSNKCDKLTWGFRGAEGILSLNPRGAQYWEVFGRLILLGLESWR